MVQFEGKRKVEPEVSFKVLMAAYSASLTNNARRKTNLNGFYAWHFIILELVFIIKS